MKESCRREWDYIFIEITDDSGSIYCLIMNKNAEELLQINCKDFD